MTHSEYSLAKIAQVWKLDPLWEVDNILVFVLFTFAELPAEA